MRTIIFPISSLFFAIALLCVGYGLLMSLVGIRLQVIGASSTLIGLVNASFFLGGVFSLFSAIKIISTIGHIRSFSVFAAILTFASLGHTLTDSILAWGFFRILSGFSLYSLLLIIESWINEKTSSSDRSRVLSIYTVVFYLAMTGGQLMLNISDATGFLLFVLASMFVSISLIPIAMTKITEPKVGEVRTISIPKLYGIAKLAIVASFAAGLLVGGFFTMAPVYAKAIGLSNESISLFMSTALVGALIAQWPIGWVSDRLGRKIAILGVAITGGVASCGLWLLGNSGTTLYISVFVLGIAIFALYPLSLARANDTTDENVNAVEISRALLMVYGIGSFIAPVLIGAGMNSLGNESMFMFFASISFALALYAFTKDRVPFEERSVYVSVPSASSTILAEFDPRQDEEWVQEQKEHIGEEEVWLERSTEEETKEEKSSTP
jgi:MFS family permease